jgi:hypothetical protein
MTFPLLRIVWGTVLVLLSLFARAGEPANVSALIAGMQSQVVKAVVIAAPVSFSFNRRLNEEDLPGRGCTYAIDGDASMESLVDVLRRGRFTEASPSANKLDVHLAIYLYARDGEKATLLLERTYDGGNAPGDARGTYNGMPLVAKAPLTSEIRALLAGIMPTTIHYTCDRDDIELAPPR